MNDPRSVYIFIMSRDLLSNVFFSKNEKIPSFLNHVPHFKFDGIKLERNFINS